MENEGKKERLSVDPRPVAQRNEEHITTRSARHAIFPPPGFRSKNILHMIMAACGYLFILAVALSLGSALDSIFFAAASLTAVDICEDWNGLWSV